MKNFILLICFISLTSFVYSQTWDVPPVFNFTGDVAGCVSDDLDVTATMVSNGWVTGLFGIEYIFYHKDIGDDDANYVQIGSISDYGTISMTIRGQGTTYETIQITQGTDWFSYSGYKALTLGIIDSYCVSRNRPIRIDMNFDVPGDYKIVKNVYSCTGTGSWTWTSYTVTGPVPPCPSGSQQDRVAANCNGAEIRSTTVYELTVYPNPDAPLIGEITQPSCAVTTGSVLIENLPEYDWTITADPGSMEVSGNTENTIFDNLNADESYTFVVSIDAAGCSSGNTEIAIIASIPDPPAVPVVESIIEASCLIITGSIIAEAQADVEFSVDGANWQVSEIFEDLVPGNYTLRARSTEDPTCISESEAANIPEVDNLPLAPVAEQVIQPTCVNNTGSIIITEQNDVEYSIDGDNWLTTTEFEDLIPGEYYLFAKSTIDNTCINVSNVPVVINDAPNFPNQGITEYIIQPTCAIATGSIVVEEQDDIHYSVDGENWQASNIFGNLIPGDYTISVMSIFDNTCITDGTEINTINEQPDPPAIPAADEIIQPTCAVNTGTIIAVLQTNVEYSLDETNWQTDVEFVNLIPGNYIITVRDIDDHTCMAQAFSLATINNVPDLPAEPVVETIIHATCLIPTGTILINEQDDVEYSLDMEDWQVSEEFANLLPGEYQLSVRSTIDNTCITTNDIPVNIDSPAGLPEIPQLDALTQPTCLEQFGFIEIVAQTDVDYSVDGENWQISESFNELLPGEYLLRVRNTDDTDCININTEPIQINDVPLAPDQPAEILGYTELCESEVAVFSVVNDDYADSYTWNLPEGWTGTSDSYSIEVTAGALGGTISITANNDCGSSDVQSLELVVNLTPPTPVISEDGFLLSSDAENGNQWYFNGTEIDGAVNQQHIAETDGTYFVIVSLNECDSEQSNTIDIVGVRIVSDIENNSVFIYPNPAKEILNIENNRNEIPERIEIFTTDARLVKTMQGNISSVCLRDISKGQYFIILHFTDSVERIGFVLE